MSKDYDYRVKFTDIRIKPPSGSKSRSKAKETRVCEHDECDLAGEFPAPKRIGDGKHYFCKKHVAEYNRAFNFFETLSDEQLKDFNENARYGFSPTWKMGAGPMGGADASKSHDPNTWKGTNVFHSQAAARAAGRGRGGQRAATGVAARALKELDLEPDAKPTDIRARYAEYVRLFHPDSNSGDRSSEEKLAKVIRAGKTLKAAGLMKD